MLRLLFLIVLFLLLLPSAAAQAVNPDLQVEAHEARVIPALDLGSAPLAPTGGGKALVIFEGSVRLSDPNAIRVRSLGADGRPAGSVITVSPPEQQRGGISPGLAGGGPAGGALAFWMASDGTALQAHVRRLDPDGRATAPTVQLRLAGSTATNAPAAAFDPSGGGSFLVAFAAGGGNGPARVAVQRIALDGTAAGLPTVVAEGPVATPSIAVRPDGGALVVWRQAVDGVREVHGRQLAPGSAAPEGPGPIRLTRSDRPTGDPDGIEYGSGALGQAVVWDGARWVVASSRLAAAVDICQSGGSAGGCDETYRLAYDGYLRAFVAGSLAPASAELLVLPEAKVVDTALIPSLAVGPVGREVVVTWPGNGIETLTYDTATFTRQAGFVLAQSSIFRGELDFTVGLTYLPGVGAYAAAYQAGTHLLVRRFLAGARDVDAAAPGIVTRPRRLRLRSRMTLSVRCRGEACPVLRVRGLSACRRDDRLCVSPVVRRVRFTGRRTSPTEMRLSLRLTARELRAVRRRRANLVLTVNAADDTGNDTRFHSSGDPRLLVKLR